ncbi:hypothetical protein KY284_007818 [Solanum tuberosum]|nr:hypothetical protein KY284_007818 [Solanum tuberosum]
MPMPLVVVIDDLDSPTGIRLGELEYEQLDPITLSYTSSTTSEPKGVVYSHSGAFLSTLSLILGWEMGIEPVYLWSLPMFHWNGWTFTWGIAARGGTNVSIRNTTTLEIYSNIVLHKVTHLCVAPIVLNIILEAKQHDQRQIMTPVQILVGGAPPPTPLLEKIERVGFNVVHAYGLTEATGPTLVCEFQAKWKKLPWEEQARLKARQGLGILTLADVDVKNFKNMESVPRDGKTTGEICLKGSSIMKGYLKNEKGEFRRDMGVIHPDGYLEIKDRCKDVIISGGENISSIEVESAILKHPYVVEASVVAMPHPRWGESPCAFFILRKYSNLKELDIIAHCRKNLPGFMVPNKVQFVEELPKTGTGKGIMEKTVNANLTDWSRRLDDALWAYHTAFKMPIGRINQLHELEEFRLRVYKSSALYKEKMKKWHDTKILQREFRVGDLVLLYNSRLRLFPSKIKSKWSGPFKVTRVFKNGKMEVEGKEGPEMSRSSATQDST